MSHPRHGIIAYLVIQLSADAGDTTAVAHLDVTVPVDGDYHLWVRYEYPTFMHQNRRAPPCYSPHRRPPTSPS